MPLSAWKGPGHDREAMDIERANFCASRGSGRMVGKRTIKELERRAKFLRESTCLQRQRWAIEARGFVF